MGKPGREHKLLTYAHAVLNPPPNLPPLGGGAGLPPPAGGRAGEGGRHRARGDATRAGRPRSQAMFIGRCARIAWTAEVTIVRRVQPPPSLPPLGGGARFPSPAGEGLGADRTHERRGALWRWDALIGPHPLPLSRAREGGDQSRALGRPNAVEAALARMFCPPLKRGRVREGAVTVPAEPRCGRDARAPRAWSSRRGAPCA